MGGNRTDSLEGKNSIKDRQAKNHTVPSKLGENKKYGLVGTRKESLGESMGNYRDTVWVEHPCLQMPEHQTH